MCSHTYVDITWSAFVGFYCFYVFCKYLIVRTDLRTYSKILFSFVCKYKHNIRTYSKPYVHMMRFAKFLQENFVCIDDCELNRPDPSLTILNTSEHASPIKYFPLFELNQSIYLLFYLMRT